MWSTTLLDLFSRYAVGWMIAMTEDGENARKLFEETCRRHGIEPGLLTSHSDRGGPMKSKTVAEFKIDIGVAQSFSRPRVSNDNPFSESQFKTVKYRPDFPDHFDGIDHSRGHFAKLFAWYNHDHSHSGLAMLAPADVFFGRTDVVIARRQLALDAAFAAHPERFVRGRPIHPRPAAQVFINPPAKVAEVTPVTAPSSTSQASTTLPAGSSLSADLARCPRTDDLDSGRPGTPPSEGSSTRVDPTVRP